MNHKLRTALTNAKGADILPYMKKASKQKTANASKPGESGVVLGVVFKPDESLSPLQNKALQIAAWYARLPKPVADSMSLAMKRVGKNKVRATEAAFKLWVAFHALSIDKRLRILAILDNPQLAEEV